jgi:hypothetical protein
MRHQERGRHYATGRLTHGKRGNLADGCWHRTSLKLNVQGKACTKAQAAAAAAGACRLTSLSAGLDTMQLKRLCSENCATPPLSGPRICSLGLTTPATAPSASHGEFPGPFPCVRHGAVREAAEASGGAAAAAMSQPGVGAGGVALSKAGATAGCGSTAQASVRGIAELGGN